MSGAEPDAGDLLVVRGVTRRFEGVTAVRNVDFTVPRGAIVGLIGPNGAGKTTLFNLITGFYQPDEGEILLDGHPLTRQRTRALGGLLPFGRGVRPLRPHRITRLGIARTFQNIRLFGTMTAL